MASALVLMMYMWYGTARHFKIGRPLPVQHCPMECIMSWL